MYDSYEELKYSAYDIMNAEDRAEQKMLNMMYDCFSKMKPEVINKELVLAIIKGFLIEWNDIGINPIIENTELYEQDKIQDWLERLKR